ncbi:MAG TPA: hypothetical protein VF168_13650 [Trueperaceae bacterium]
MGFDLLTGPPGSGKTSLLIERAVELSARGRRVWWAGLPSQRSDVYRRATRQGALLGLEFQTMQQVYYRLLAHARRLKPLIVGTGRLALVGEALAYERKRLPSPGEARLFAAAVAEAKRYAVGPADLPAGDSELERLRTVFRTYERLKGDAWDYDDFRIEALRLAESGAASPEADALIVDGFRELSPVDLHLLSLLGERCEVRLALPQAPAGLIPGKVLAPRDAASRTVYRAPNPVSEARWVLNSLKRDLACGVDPLDLAVILPGGESVAFSALADEYGVPVMDERPTSLADTVPGRLLVELLELPDYPTASRLLPVRELASLADAAIEEGVAGHAAFERLARRLGVGASWESWLARLRVPEEGSAARIDAWATSLVDLALSLADLELEVDGPRGALRVADSGGTGTTRRSGAEVLPERFREQALLRAKEAQRVAAGQGFRAWWAALLADTHTSVRRPGGVALMDERQASGRRFRRAYLMRANEGAYGAGEREDYFVPEECREPLAALLEGARSVLPRRFEGRERLLFEELTSLADEVVVTYPSGDQGGPLLPETGLLGDAVPQPLPAQQLGSRIELAVGESYLADRSRTGELTVGWPITLEDLRRFDQCAMRQWLEGLLGERRDEPAAPWWRSFRQELLAQTRLDAGRLELLCSRYPKAASWLERHRQLLLELSFGVALPVVPNHVSARLDAAVTAQGEARIYAFAPPAEVADRPSAEQFIEGRWTELWAAGHMLERFPQQVEGVRLFAWPFLGDPIEAYDGAIGYEWGRIASRRRRAQEALERLRNGSIEPAPGFHCGSCSVRDVCREGAQS